MTLEGVDFSPDFLKQQGANGEAMAEDERSNTDTISIELISKHLQSVLDDLAIITAEIEEMKAKNKSK